MEKNIVFSNVMFTWEKNVAANRAESVRWMLQIPSLQIESGSHVFIQGPSGSGKSSFLSLLAGLISPSAGEIYIAGNPLHNTSSRQRDSLRAQYMGFVFQQLNLITYLSVVENVLLPVYFSRSDKTANTIANQRAEALLTRLGLNAELWQQSAGNLSVGQQQRVAIARALITEPAILIADEPTSALDAANRDAFIDVMLKESARLGTTVIFVSHDAALKRHFSRHIELQRDNTGVVHCIEHTEASGSAAQKMAEDV